MFKPRLSILLAAPFVALIIAMGSLIAFVGYRSGSKAAAQMAASIHEQVDARVSEHLRAFMTIPQLINRLNCEQLTAGGGGPVDLESLGRHLFSELLAFESVTTIEYADEQGRYVGPARGLFGAELAYGVAGVDGNFTLYERNRAGENLGTLYSASNYDSRQQSWYQLAANSQRATWTPIYFWPNGDIGLDAVSSVRIAGQLQGVFDTAIKLNSINTVLREAVPTPNSKVFLIDEDRLLIASSTAEQLYKPDGAELKRLPAGKSTDPVIASVSAYLQQNLSSLGDLSQAYRFQLKGLRPVELVSVAPYRDGYGLKWLLIVVTPVSDLASALEEGNRTTLLLNLALLFAAVIAALWLANRVSRPLSLLARSTQRLAEGSFEQPIELRRRDEIGELAQAFNLMAARIVEDIAALRESEAKYRRLVELASEGIWAEDANDVIAFVNPQMGRMLGYAPEELLGRKSIEFMHPEDLVHSDKGDLVNAEEIGAARRRGESTNYERRYKRADGTDLWCLVSGAPILGDAGQYLGSFGMLTDITERKRAEAERAVFEEYLRQSQKMEAIGTLAGGIAHDFNNLLFAILGYGEMILDSLEPDSISYDNMKAVIAAGQRAKGLVQQILTFSRKTEVKHVPLDLRMYVKEVAKLLSPATPTTLEIRQSITPGSAVVMADPTELHQVLMNLCTNAAHAIGNNTGVIEISLRETEISPEFTPPRSFILAPGTYMELSVSDNGTGIPPEIQQRIFDPFFTTKPQGKGTGMGLSVVHGIVKKLGGEVMVESKVGEGSRFTIFLPAIRGAGGAESTDTVKPPRGSARIIVVDDEEDIRNMLHQSLTSLGYQVTCCGSGRTALELLRADASCCDVLITDQTMPQLTGVELVQHVHEMRPGLPVILCTGHSEAITAETASSLGLAGLMYKPIEMIDLARVIQSALC